MSLARFKTLHYSAVIPLFIRAMSAGKAPTIYGDARQSRFYLCQQYVHANLLAATQPDVGGGREYCLRSIAIHCSIW